MARKYGYSEISNEDFLEFGRELEQGAWGLLQVPHSAQALDLFALAAPALWKLRLSQARAQLARVLEETADGALEALDEAWEAQQRRLHLSLSLHEIGYNPAKAQAARRLRQLLLKGETSVHPLPSYEKEVELGLEQAAFLQTNAQGASDLELLELDSVLEAIRLATDELARALGKSFGGPGPAPLSIRARAAWAQCRDAFEHVHAELDYWIVQLPENAPRARLVELRDSLLRLLQSSRERSAS